MSGTPESAAIEDTLRGRRRELVDVYRDLHTHPELGFEEHRTSRVVADSLTAMGMEVVTGVGVTGVVGVTRNGDGPTVLVRADLDALPIRERTGLPYASAGVADHDGLDVPVMHACGHDVHTTALLGTVDVLHRNRGMWSGTVVAVAQPAEELLRGARAMIADGLLERFPRPDAAVAQHVCAAPVGQVFHADADCLAACDNLLLTVFGIGGHASRPELCVNAAQVAAQISRRLDGLVSREVGGSDSAVVTVGAINGGDAFNVVPDVATLKVTVRTYSPAVRRRLLETIDRLVIAECQSAGCPRPPSVEHVVSCPATVNDAALVEVVRRAHRETLPAGSVRVKAPEMGSEDFGEFGAAGIPSVYYSFGALDPRQFVESRGSEPPGEHSPHFAPSLEAVTTGARLLTVATMALLRR